jgi:type IV pilus assembly protein PilC
MPQFAYNARDASGRMDAGTLVAGSLGEATRALRADGKTILDVHEAAEGGAAAWSPPAARKRIKRRDVLFFASQLAIMVDTGVPLDEALDAIAAQTDHSGLRAVVADVCTQVQGGIEFSTALRRHPKVFDNLFVSLMEASEASGTMGRMLNRVSEYMVREHETRRRVKGAMLYPACILSFCVVVVVGLLIGVLPRFQKIYAGKGALLPAPTRALLALSAGMIAYWPFLLGGTAALIVGAVLYFRSPAGRVALDRLRIRLPILGPMFRKAYLARSLRTMATMINSGVSILDGLAITAGASGNTCFARIWHDVADRVRQGAGLSDRLFDRELIPRSVAQMIQAGERTGTLGNVTARVAAFCEEELEVTIKSATALIEPAMIVIMGLLVSGIAMALLLPVFSISRIVAAPQ